MSDIMQHFEKPSYRNVDSNTAIVLSQENRDTNSCSILENKEAQSNSVEDHRTEKSSFQSAWSRNMLNILRAKLNNFRGFQGSSEYDCKPFIVDGCRVGTIPPFVLPHLENYPAVFKLVKSEDNCIEHVTFAPKLKTFDERSKKIEEVLQEFRQKDLFVTLKGWRNESFAVSSAFNQKRLFKIERSAACLFGTTQYGVHVNGYFKAKSNGMLYMWIARRSPMKPTGPGKLDQIAAGGITWRSSITETLFKECKEEASIPEYLVQRAVPAGALSFIFEDNRGIFPGVQFVYDICLPEDFKPKVNDGEVSEFYCWPIEKVKEKIATKEFKPNCALVVLDFLIRHGEINPQTEPNFLDFILWSHKPPH
ncbi:uncharacterized protein YJR142W-like [Actinia tenebrosa]|uniref:Uncharacterized protein YJR142W-like n=1 Tax=Actinia tenebrosa TaxID=6105 RepID=A0A6P8ITV0_ACTTE|nr:uncharacterized protein YJR142W-like [Actinia tenebrosa]XP_031570671.1 uncharacterized protein YJR142W-like [Actinia tenebrosa]